MATFLAYTVDKVEDSIVSGVKEVTLDNLHEGNVVIRAHYSSINYKDSLAIQPHGKILRSYPMIPGIDVSGVVVESNDESIEIGDEVLVTGYDLGVSHTGGFSEYVRVKSEWIIKLPKNLSLKEAMKIGTAGFTAGLSIAALEQGGLKGEEKPTVLVTGATGGVGSVAIQILHKLGCTVHALSRKKEEEQDRLRAVGADKVLTIDEMTNGQSKPLAKETYEYIVDTVGGDVVSKLLPYVRYGGVVTLCGNVAGVRLETTVFPFILRNISLVGIDSVQTNRQLRLKVWEKFATEWKITDDLPVQTVTLQQLDEVFEKLQAGTHVGRTVVELI